MTSAVGGPVSPLAVDSLDMWGAAAGLPEQIETALAAGRAIGPLPNRDEIDHVVVLGMGGSGIAGDVLAAAALNLSTVPVSVVKTYELPAFVGSHTLVFAVSCSGNTEETLSATEAAFAVGASVFVVAGDGELARMAGERGAPLVPVPRDIPQPRAAIGAMTVPLLVVAERIGLLSGAMEQLTRSLATLMARRDQLVGPASPAQEIARRIDRRIPLVHGAYGLPAVAALRWKTQVNENGKSPAIWAEQPELCHNELAGWAQNGDMTRQILTVVELRTADDHAQIARRFDWMGETLREVVADVVEVWATGETLLGRFFDLVLVGDFVSLHLANHEGIDPGPVPILGELKAYLSS